MSDCEPLTPHQRYGFDYDIDKWYEQCKSFTFKTEFIPIDIEEANVLRKHYDIHVKLKSDELSSEEYACYKNLESKIQTILDKKFYSEEMDTSVAFVRLSGRSPKDAVISSLAMNQNLQKFLYEKRASYKFKDISPILKQNDEFIAFFSAQKESMKFENSQQILQVHSESLRVYEDLQHAINYKINDWSLKMAFREWIWDMDISFEFRGFVVDGKLTALSQYFDMLYFEHLIQNKEFYLKIIQQFFESVKHMLPWDTCVMDFLITCENDDVEELECLRSEDFLVRLIEFNPFNRYTGAALFSWDRDREILEGKSPFEFRLQTKPIEIIKDSSYSDENFSADVSMQLNLQHVETSILDEYADTLKLVEEFVSDDVQRINSNLRYALQKVQKENLLTFETQVNE